CLYGSACYASACAAYLSHPRHASCNGCCCCCGAKGWADYWNTGQRRERLLCALVCLDDGLRDSGSFGDSHHLGVFRAEHLGERFNVGRHLAERGGGLADHHVDARLLDLRHPVCMFLRHLLLKGHVSALDFKLQLFGFPQPFHGLGIALLFGLRLSLVTCLLIVEPATRQGRYLPTDSALYVCAERAAAALQFSGGLLGGIEFGGEGAHLGHLVRRCVAVECQLGLPHCQLLGVERGLVQLFAQPGQHICVILGCPPRLLAAF